MRTQNHFCHHQQQALQPQHLEQRNVFLLCFLLMVSVTATQAIPARMFSSGDSSKLVPMSSATLPGNQLNHVRLPEIIPEEELELESLKGKGPSSTKVGAVSKKSSAIDSSSYSPTTSKPVANPKKPENEETPALSDNANSLKYGGVHAELEEALVNLAHIPPSKSPSLSVSSVKSPIGDSILQQQRKRTRSSSGMGLLGPRVNLEVDYTPQDIAEYIFWMGDERSVELAINDFIQDGLITPQDAIRFLEEVKLELNSLRNRYASNINGAMGRGISSGYDDNSIKGFWETPIRTMSKKSASSNLFGSYPSYYAARMQGLGDGYATNGLSSLEELMDYEDTIEKMKQRQVEPELDSRKQREYALHGIIYKLARELFSMGFQQSPGTSVPTFTTFIESVAVNEDIPKDLERSVLETLVQALVDAANEHGLLIAKSSGASAELGRKLSANLGGQKPIIIKKKSA